MTLLRRDARANTLENPLLPLTSTTLLDWLTGPKVAAGVTVTEKKSLGLTAVFRAVSLLSGTIGALPIGAYRYQDDRRVPAGQRSAAEKLLRKPHPDLTTFEFFELVVCHLCLWGNFYARILKNQRGEIAELWPLMPNEVRAGRAKGGTKVYEISGDYDTDGQAKPYTDAEIFHIPGMGYDGVCGVSPIRAARQGLGLAMAAEEFGARFFGSGSLASGVLQTEQRLTQEQADALKDRWKERVGGLQNAHEAIVLDRGAKFEQLTINPEDAQFVETRRFQVAEVARLFGIPPHMLMDMERSTSWGTGIEEQKIAWVVYTLTPWLTRIEQRWTMKLCPADTIYTKFRVQGLLRGDSKARAEFYRAMRELGIYNANDILELEDHEPIDGIAGSMYWRPLNMGDASKEPTEKEPAPAPAPAQEGV